jgi:glyoxylase-like metal-dependent hydrolase (beta-lactamase superfamily II)
MRTLARAFTLARASIRRCAAALIAAAIAGGCAHTGGEQASTVQRMYAFNCGESRTTDVSRWSPGVGVGQPWEFSNNCYLIRHAKGLMIWDTGFNDSVAGMPDGLVAAGGALRAKLSKTLAAQLSEIGVKPTDVTVIAFSHFHPDHSGNANLFSSATLYIQEVEYDAAFGPEPQKYGFQPQFYDKLRANRVVKLKGDRDVFGDGAVVILSTPGHTPGHQSLLVRLPKTGAIILSGDLVHFQSNWESRRVPGMNFSRDQSSASMDRVAALIVSEKAQFWINHDRVQSEKTPRPPAFLD